MYISSNKLSESIDYQIWSQLSDSDKILSLADLLHDYDNNIFYNDYNDDADIAIIQAKFNLSELLGIGIIGDNMKYAIVYDEKVQGSNGGTFTAGAWRQRDLNSKIDNDSLVSISTNNVTISIAGKYIVRATCPAFGVNHHQCRLTKNNVLLQQGSSEYINGLTTMSKSQVIWQGDLVVGDVLRLEHQCESTYATYGFGTGDGSNFGVEIFSIMELIQWT